MTKSFLKLELSMEQLCFGNKCRHVLGLSFSKLCHFFGSRNIAASEVELNHFAAILHVYAGGLNFMK